MSGSSTSRRMPAAFLSHGNPMNALQRNRYTEAWRAFGQAMPRPKAILVVSAHWYTNATAVTHMAQPRTIHDFYGFPQELFDVQYPAPGAPEVAEMVADCCKPRWVGQDVDSWGIDHGTWSVLRHAFPDATIPVVQMSLNAFKPFEVLSLLDHADYDVSVPTPDHFMPLLYSAGLAGDEPMDLLIDGHAAGSISMAAYTLGLDQDLTPTDDAGPAAALPDSFPALDSNL